MRFILTICIWLVIVGGLWLYTRQRDATISQAVASYADLSVDETFAIELTPTFSVEDDPFALQVEESSSSGMELRLNGTAIPLPDQPVQRGQVVRLDDVSGLLRGHNEIYLKASPPAGENSIEQGVRIKLFSGSELIRDHTVWSGSGALVSGGFSFDYQAEKEEGHGH